MSLTITPQQLKDPILLKKFLEQQKNHAGFKDFIQSNLLRVCKLGGLTKSVEILLSYGAAPDGYNLPVKETFHVENLNTPLQYCVINDDRDSVKLLLAQKADPNLRGIKGSEEDLDDVRLNLPPLHLATRHGHRSMVEILLKSGGSQSPLPETGEYPIHIAAREGHVHLLNLFCTFDNWWVNKRTERPAQITDNSFTSKVPLHISVEHAHLDCVQALVNQFDADVNIKDGKENSSLHLLLLNSPRDQNDSNIRYAIALALLKTDIDLNSKNSDGFTPLDLAAKNGYPKIAQLLHSLKGVSGISSRKRDGSEKDNSFDEFSIKKKSKSMENSSNTFRETFVITKPSITPMYYETETNHSPNLDNEISSFSISTKDSSERMYISFDKNQTPKSMTSQNNITSNISNKPTNQTEFTESKPPHREINSIPRSENTDREPNLRSRIHTSKVTTVIKETSFWKSAPEEQLRQYYYIPKPEKSFEIEKETPVFDPQKPYFPKRRGSLSPVSFMSEGYRRGLKFRVLGKVPKAYNKNDMESARKKFILHPPIGIESSQESADRTQLSIVSLPDFQTKDEIWIKSIERRMQWLETFQKLRWKSDIMLDPNKKYLSSHLDPKFMGQDKVRGKLIGFYPRPYKSFGPIEIKTDALEQAMEELSDYEDEGWEIRKSYHEHYPITNWVKNDGQRICPMEIDDESYHHELKQPDHWGDDESDKEQDPKRSSCCSIKIDDVVHVVQIADIDDNKNKDIPSLHEDGGHIDLDINKKQGNSDVITLVSTHKPEITQKETFQLVDVNVDDDDEKQNAKQPVLPKVPSSKSKIKDDLKNVKLVKKKTKTDIEQTTTVEFIKGSVPQSPNADEKLNKGKSVKSEEKTTITRKSSKDRNVKKVKKSVSTQDDQPSISKEDENAVQDEDTPIKKSKLKENAEDKFEQAKDGTSDEISNIKDPDSTTTINVDTDEKQNNDSTVTENNLVDINVDEKIEEQIEDNSRPEKSSKPKSKAHGAQCVRVKKKTRPSLDNVVNPPGNWTQAVIDKLFLSDKWKDDQDIDNEISSYEPTDDVKYIDGGEINKNVEVEDDEENELSFNIDQKGKNIVKIPDQVKKESNLDDGEVIQIKTSEKKKKSVSDDKEKVKDEIIGKSDKKKKRTTKADTNEIENNFSESKDDNKIEVTPEDSKQENNEVNIPENDGLNLQNLDVNKNVKRKDSKKKGKSEKGFSDEKVEDVILTPAIDENKSTDIQTKDNEITSDSNKKKSNEDDLGIIPPKRKGSMKKKKQVNDFENLSPKEEGNDDNKHIDSSTSLVKRKKSRSKSEDISDETKVKNSEQDEDLYQPMSNTANKDGNESIDVEKDKTVTNLQDSEVIQKRKVKRKDSKTKIKTDTTYFNDQENIYLTNDSDQIEKVKHGDEDVENDFINIKKKRQGSKRKPKSDTGGSIEQDHLYLSTNRDADQIELNEKKREDFKKRDKDDKVSLDENKSLGKPDEDHHMRTTDDPTPKDANNLDVLIPIEHPSSDEKTSRPSKRTDRTVKDKVGTKSNLDNIVDVPKDFPQEINSPITDDSKTLDTNSTQIINTEETSDHQYYNISDLPTKDSQKDKNKETYDDVNEDSYKGKSKDGVNLNKSKETNIDDLFQVTDEIKSKEIEENDDKARKGTKKKLKKKKSETIQDVTKEKFVELPEKYDDVPPTDDLNTIQDEPALSDSDFNSSDPDASHYVEYHVSLGPDYSGKSRIKKAKSMDSESNLKETEQTTEENEIETKDRDANKNEILFETDKSKGKLKTRDDSSIDTKSKTKKKSKKSSELSERTTETTTTETTEIHDQEVRKKPKGKKVKNRIETIDNEKDEPSQLNDDTKLTPGEGYFDKQMQDDGLKLEDDKESDKIWTSKEKSKETVIDNYSEEKGGVTKKKKSKNKTTPTQLSDEVHENLPFQDGDENYNKKLKKHTTVQNNDVEGIETNLDDEEEFDKNNLMNKKNTSNEKDDKNKTTEISTVEIIENYDDERGTKEKIKKKKIKKSKEDEITEFTSLRDDDLIKLDEDIIEVKSKTEEDETLKAKGINDFTIDKFEEKDEKEIAKTKKKRKDGYLEETMTTTTLIEEDWKSKQKDASGKKSNDQTTIISEKENIDDKEIDKDENEKPKRKKKGKTNYLEETITTTTETLIDDDLKYKKGKISEGIATTKDKGKKQIKDEVVTEEIFDEDSEFIKNKSRKSKKYRDGFLEDTTTITRETLIEDDWKSKDKSNNTENIAKTSGKGKKQEELINEDEVVAEEIFDEDDERKSDKLKKGKSYKNSYLEETTTVTETLIEDRKSKKGKKYNSEEISKALDNGRKQQEFVNKDEIVSEETFDEDDDYQRGKTKKVKKPKDGYLKEITTTTTDTIIEDDWKSKQRGKDKIKMNNNQDDVKTADKSNKDFKNTTDEEISVEENKNKRKEKRKNGYLEEDTTTTTTLIEEKWRSKDKDKKKSNSFEIDDKRKFIETDFDCQEPLPPSSREKDSTPGSKPPLKRNIPPLIHKNQQNWDRQISSPAYSDQDFSIQPLSITLPNLVIDSPKDDDSTPSGGHIPRQYSSTPKYSEELTKETTETTTIDTLRWKRRPRRRTRSVSFESIPKKQFHDKPLNSGIPDKTLQQAAFEMLQLNQAEVWRKSWKTNPVVYTRGIYRPQQPLYKRDMVGENIPGKTDESRISQVFLPSLDDSRMGSASPDKVIEKSPDFSADEINFTDEDDIDDEQRLEDENGHMVNLPANLSPYSKSFSPFIYNSLTRKVTYVKPLRRKRQYNSLSLYPIRGPVNMNQSADLPPNITEPGPVDFTKYGYLSKLWMECVDKKTVQKSNTMYLSVLPSGATPLDSLENTLLRRYLQRSGATAESLKDSKDGSQWVIARGRSVRLAKRKWMEQKENMLGVEGAGMSFHEGSPNRSTINQSFANHPSSMLFFKVDQINWPDLAWILFDGIQSDAETVRTIADIRLKHQDDAGAQIRDLMSRWWLKKGDEATIEELQTALEFVRIPYVQEEDENASFFYPVKESDEDELDEDFGNRSMGRVQQLMIQEVSENDIDVSRMMIEYDHNASYAALTGPQFNKEHESSKRLSSTHLQVPSIRESKQSLGSVFKDKFRLSSSSLQRSHSNLPSKQISLPMDSSVNLGSQSSFRAFASGLMGRKAGSKEEPVVEVSTADDQDHKISFKSKGQISSYDLESNL